MTQDDAGSAPMLGSVAGSEWRFGAIDNKQELIDEARRASFFGVPVGELSRTELLAAFGSLLKQKMRDQELADSVKNMFALAKRWQS